MSNHEISKRLQQKIGNHPLPLLSTTRGKNEENGLRNFLLKRKSKFTWQYKCGPTNCSFYRTEACSCWIMLINFCCLNNEIWKNQFLPYSSRSILQLANSYSCASHALHSPKILICFQYPLLFAKLWFNISTLLLLLDSINRRVN